MSHTTLFKSHQRSPVNLVATLGTLALSLGAILADVVSSTARAQEGATPPRWIWFPTGRPPGETPAESRYFRKVFAVKEASRLALDVTAHHTYILYIDGKEVARGGDWHRVQRVEATLTTGRHVLAAIASNESPGPAAFLVRGGVLPLGQGVPIHTNASWKTSGTVPSGVAWTALDFDDSAWARAADLGALGTGPWTNLVFESGDLSGRFKVPPGFKIEQVASANVTGSVVSFGFDPQGRPCVGIEQGPIARLDDADHDGRFESRFELTPQMKNCQGFSFIHGCLYAVGQGPKGAGLYRLKDRDGDGVFETVSLIRDTVYVEDGKPDRPGMMQEHGPHSVALGPDGCLYANNGNHVHLSPPIDPRSPVNVSYFGELLPHYNDAIGHAAGIMEPGGEILRSDDDGRTWKRVAAGFRNEYDFAFNRDGELFTFDSDMEWDVGLPWYRPVRVNHCALGAEFGWRNGSGKWAEFNFDSLPGTLDTGRGSPTGVTFYQGKQFPPEYDDRFLICDWSQGRILAVALSRSGATYSAKATELVSGQPLNCTDLEVGPDGALYFSTGGRGTQGGLFRVSWTGARPLPTPADPIIEALGIGSPQSSFARARIDQIHRQLGDTFSQRLAEVMVDPKAPPATRTRALDLITQFEPRTLPELVLHALAKDAEPLVRARAVTMLGLRSTASVQASLTDALADRDPFVRRHACEGLIEQPPATIPVAALLPLLADPDRWIRFSARVAIEHAEPARYREQILASKQARPLIEGMLALARAGHMDRAAQDDLLARQQALFQTRLTPADRLDLLRLIEVTYLLGPQKAEAPISAGFRPILLAAFATSTRDAPIDRELARLLAFLGEPKAVDAILQHQAVSALIKGDLALERANQIHDAYCLRVLKQGWNTGSKRRLWAWYEAASHWDGGYSFLGYLDLMLKDLVALLDADEQRAFLAEGQENPFPTRALVRSIDLNAKPERVADLVALYARLVPSGSSGMSAELSRLIVEVLGRSTLREAHDALRGLARLDPARRGLIARALGDHPTADDLGILVEALDTRDPNTASLIVAALRKVDRAPSGPEALRNLIRLARRGGPPMLHVLNDLAGRWTGARVSGDFAAALAAWEKLYHERYPQGPALDDGSAVGGGQNAYSLADLVQGVLQSEPMRNASPERGKLVIVKARCLDCHKFGDQGQGLGPDLTTINSRFRPHEILESIVEPSKVISDQYKPLTIATTEGKVYNGMPVANDGPNLVVLLSDGTKVTIPKADIDEKKESKVSVMPEGQLNTLSLQEIADLIALFNSMPRVAVPTDGGTAPK